ncbi:tetratricopeptide repeat protein [Saccharicrinis carchari]|uniref:tetratricopeptide repeat protein n=1 Tax=Saccharicrinis carchari TaxID=1168039 RepID=UPI00163D9B16|nr:tetratricopeptide repeat protein [Saccharicrinis carchari]
MKNETVQTKLSNKQTHIQRAYALLNTSKAYRASCEYNKALEYGFEALAEIEKTNDKPKIAESLNYIGILQRQLNKYDQALQYYQQARNLNEESKNKQGCVKNLNNIGIAYRHLKQYDKALDYYLQAVQLKNEIGDKSGLSKTLNNIGILFRKLGDHNKSLQYLEQSLKLKEEYNDTISTAKTLNNIGIVYKDLNQHQKALDYLLQSLQFKEELNNTIGIAVTYNNIGSVYGSLEQHTKALEYYQKSLSLRKKSCHPKDIALLYNNIGGTLIQLGNYAKARLHLDWARDIAKELNNIELITENYQHSSELYTLERNYEKAYRDYMLLSLLKDSMQSLQNKQNVKHIEAQYNFSKKEEELKYLEEQRIFAIKMTALLILLAVFMTSIVIYIAYRLKNKNNLLLKHKNSELEQQKTALKESQLRYRQLVENAGEVILVEQGGLCKYVNKRITATLGYQPDQLTGTSIYKIVHPEDKPLLKASLKHISKNEKAPVVLTFRALNKALEFKWIEINTVRFIWEGKPASLSFLEDITERKLQEEALSKAKKKAEESDRLKTAFLANMSHEIRTPMNAILGFTDLLKQSQPNEKEREAYINIIDHGGQLLLSIINDIIDISKIESGQMTVRNTMVNLSQQVRLTHKLLQHEAYKKNLRFEISIDQETECYTDQEKIQAILTNLVKNAIKFTHSGHVKFGFETKGDNIRFFVEDSGLGIKKDRQPYIFERFVQAEQAFPQEGTGLGLAISKAFVEMLNGNIWLESEPGKGSTFYFTIPAFPQ